MHRALKSDDESVFVLKMEPVNDYEVRSEGGLKICTCQVGF
jgi:hypothetical protein